MVHISVCASVNNIILLRDKINFYDKKPFYTMYNIIIIIIFTVPSTHRSTCSTAGPSLATATTVQMLRTALISVTCVLVIMSALMFLFGITIKLHN